jgi:hypothetical protein
MRRIAGMHRTAKQAVFRRLDSNQDEQLQRLLGCQLPHAGVSVHAVTGHFAVAASIHDTGRTVGIAGSSMPASHLLVLSLRSGVRHACACPAFDLMVKPAAPPDIDAETPVVVLANVLPHRLRVMALQRRSAEPIGRCAGDLHPEPPGRLGQRRSVRSSCPARATHGLWPADHLWPWDVGSTQEVARLTAPGRVSRCRWDRGSL